MDIRNDKKMPHNGHKKLWDALDALDIFEVWVVPADYLRLCLRPKRMSTLFNKHTGYDKKVRQFDAPPSEKLPSGGIVIIRTK